MSLAQPPSFYNPAAAFNPFGPAATLGSDQILPRASPGLPAIVATSEEAPLHAPQGRVPTNVSSLAPPPSLSRPESRPDFMRGFGLDATEEEEEPVEEPSIEKPIRSEEEEAEEAEAPDATDVSQEVNIDELEAEETIQDSVSTVAQSRIHSRHVSKLSAALSLRSVGRVEEPVVLQSSAIPEMSPTAEPSGEDEIEDVDVDVDAVAEWTGSEDLGVTSDDEVCLFLYRGSMTSQSNAPLSSHRASESGQTPQTKRGPDKIVYIAGCYVDLDTVTLRHPEGYPTSLVLPEILMLVV